MAIKYIQLNILFINLNILYINILNTEYTIYIHSVYLNILFILYLVYEKANCLPHNYRHWKTNEEQKNEK